MRDKGVTQSPRAALMSSPSFSPSSSLIPTPFFSPPFHLNSCLWGRLGGTCWQKTLSEQELSSSLFPRPSSYAFSFCFSLAWFTSERQQKVSVLHLHVGLAFNKQNRSLTGRWEKASASVIWGDATTFPCPANLFVIQQLVPAWSSDSLMHTVVDLTVNDTIRQRVFFSTLSISLVSL